MVIKPEGTKFSPQHTVVHVLFEVKTLGAN